MDYKPTIELTRWVVKICYQFGTIPFRWDDRNQRIEEIVCIAGRIRWEIVTTVGICIKSLLAVSLILVIDTISISRPEDFFRLCVGVVCALLIVLDLHVIRFKNEIRLAMNNQNQYCTLFQGKHK